MNRQQSQIALSQLIIRRADAGNHQRTPWAQLRIRQQLALGHARARGNRAVPIDILRGKGFAVVILHFPHDARDEILSAGQLIALDHPRKIIQTRAGHVQLFLFQPQIQCQTRARLLRHAADADGAHAAKALRRFARTGKRQSAVSA